MGNNTVYPRARSQQLRGRISISRASIFGQYDSIFVLPVTGVEMLLARQSAGIQTGILPLSGIV